VHIESILPFLHEKSFPQRQVLRVRINSKPFQHPPLNDNEINIKLFLNIQLKVNQPRQHSPLKRLRRLVERSIVHPGVLRSMDKTILQGPTPQDKHELLETAAQKQANSACFCHFAGILQPCHHVLQLQTVHELKGVQGDYQW